MDWVCVEGKEKKQVNVLIGSVDDELSHPKLSILIGVLPQTLNSHCQSLNKKKKNKKIISFEFSFYGEEEETK